MNKLARLIIEDGQPIRAIHNYLIEVVEDLQEFSHFAEHEIDEEEFKNCLREALDLLTQEIE